MTNMSKYQRLYWYPKIAEHQGGEFCKGCGISFDSDWNNKKIQNLVIDKINNDGNHAISDNIVSDFQLLCIACNRIKNPSKIPEDLTRTQSEATNRRAEKPLMEWLMDMLRSGETVDWKYFVSEGSYKFDISPETIEKRYAKKYFSSYAKSSPFCLHTDDLNHTVILLKNREDPKSNLDMNRKNNGVVNKKNSNLDIDPLTPTPSLIDDLRLDEK